LVSRPVARGRSPGARRPFTVPPHLTRRLQRAQPRNRTSTSGATPMRAPTQAELERLVEQLAAHRDRLQQEIVGLKRSREQLRRACLAMEARCSRARAEEIQHEKVITCVHTAHAGVIPWRVAGVRLFFLIVSDESDVQASASTQGRSRRAARWCEDPSRAAARRLGSRRACGLRSRRRNLSAL
jgi:hypothetical protein